VEAGRSARLHLDRLGEWTDWTLRAGAVALPLAVWPSAGDEFVLPKLAVLHALVAVLLALRLATWAVRPRVTVVRTPLDLPLAAFVASAALSTLVAVDVGVAFFGADLRYEGLLTITCYALLFWLAVQALDAGRARGVLRALLVGGYVAALLGIVQSVVGGVLVGGVSSVETARTFGGALRASSTFGNAYPLGGFLAMVLPVAAYELAAVRSVEDRLLAANAVVVIGLGLLLTYSRAAWIGAAIGLTLVAVPPAIALARRRPALAVAAVAAVALTAVGGGLAGAGRTAPAWASAVSTRAASLADPVQGSGATRLHLWQDTLHLVAARPLVGWGPDTFGLVYPRFESGDWAGGALVDKAHSDVLQVAATQGLVGVAAYLALAAAILAAFWRGRARPGALPLLGAWIAYQVPLQLDFSWLPLAAPAWLLVAAAVAVWRSPEAAAV
jgi:putative inorganic carbon (HCO3(-)) transporter